MLFERLFFYLKLLLLLTVLSAEGRKKRRNRKKEPLGDDPNADGGSSIDNLCDIASPLIIYCYCNTVDKDKAEEGNCWIFNDTSDENFENVWEGFSTQTKIKHLTLHLRPDGTLKQIPTVAIMHLPDLQWFEVQYATVSTVHSYSFGNSSSIEKISLARNSIKIIEPFSFANLPSLSSITLGENHLTEIKRNVFSNLPKLTHLYIDRNNITSIEDFAFIELESLKELELFSNQIQAIVPETFKGLYALERLDLHKNWIEVLGDLTFQDLKKLKTLDLKGNSIKFIAPKSFYGLAKLQKLVLQDNKLLALGSDIFKFFDNLLYLDLRQNVLETLTKETVHPLIQNLKKEQMHIFLEGNIFRCDTRLMWMFSLYNSTKSNSLKTALEEVFCYLETGTLPPRLEGLEATPSYEITTMGIGPRMELLKLLPSELPDPLLRTPATFTQEDCDHTEDNKTQKMDNTEEGMKPRGGGRGRGRGRKYRTTQSPPVSSDRDEQNDMASPHSTLAKDSDNQKSNPGVSHRDIQPASPVHDSRPYSEDETWSSAVRFSATSRVTLVAMACFISSISV